jgi:hypothetical protein
MKYRYLFLVAILVLALISMPASAFTAQKVVITVNNEGDANINFNYQLTWMESFVYSFIPNKEQIVTSALESRFPSKEVDNIQVSRTSTDLIVRKFAKVTTSGGITTYKTPAVSFTMAQTLLNNYPRIARAITPDFSPEETIVRFPGSGDTYTYIGVDRIPKITYTV